MPNPVVLRRLTGKRKKSYILRDNFTTPQSAPITSPRTCEPGPRTLQVVDTLNKASINANSKLEVLAAGVGGNFADPRFNTTQTLPRVAGRGVFLTATPGTLGNAFRFGWDLSNVSLNTPPHTFSFDTNLRYYTHNGVTGTEINVGTFTAGVTYRLAMILRPNGALAYVKGGIYSEWKLLWVGFGMTSTPLNAIIRKGNGGTDLYDDLKIYDMPAPYNVDFTVCSGYSATPSANDTITMLSDSIVEMTWNAVTGQTWELSVRYTDDNNRWCIRGSQGGSTIKLIQIQAGVETERSSAAQTWTNGQSYRLVAVCDTQTITTYVNDVQKNTYTSASFNQSATGAKTDKSGTNLAAWPRNPTGRELSLIDGV